MSAAISALEALFQHREGLGKEAFAEFEQLFLGNEPFLDKVKSFDQLIAKYAALAELEEFAFDLLMVHHLSTHVKDESYFDTKEWLDIEDKTIERGTELLNLLLYITESKDAEVEPTLEDFLHEFLLIDEDEFQDEHRIYEPLIEHQEVGEATMESIREIASQIDAKSDIKELFVPMVLFFQAAEETSIPQETYTGLNPTERSLFACMMNYYKA